VISPKGDNKPTSLLFGTSVFDIKLELPASEDMEVKDGLRLFRLHAALIACAPGQFISNPIDLRAALAMLPDASDLLRHLLDGGHSTIAGRLAGAFRNIGRERIANDIVQTMRAAGYTVIESDPFEDKPSSTFSARETSPYVNRLRLMWDCMRAPIIEIVPKPPGIVTDAASYLKQVDELYVSDAYHSLSIEGYQVDAELIERVRSGDWNPDREKADRDHRDALAARGYWQAFQAAKKSVARVLSGENPGCVVDDDHGTWYRELFGPSVTAGILKPANLAGYRNAPVYIRRSMHVPPGVEAMRELMLTFFNLLRDEESPAVRVVMGHFAFVYIHPYFDGNGRMGRLLMNTMLAAGGYPWTIIPVERRSEYMAALEAASVNQDIAPFARFLGDLVICNFQESHSGR
jgi:hypothetical protein